MPRTSDRFPGALIEEEILFDDRGPGGDNDGDPTTEGALRRVTNVLRIFVGAAVRQVLQIKNPPAGFDDVDMSGITNGQGLAYNTTSKQFEPQTFAGGYDSTTHRAEDQLVHDIAEDSFEEYTYSGNKVTSIIVWTDSGKTQKIREALFTYSGSKVQTIVTKQYDGAGTLIVGETMTDGGNTISSIQYNQINFCIFFKITFSPFFPR